MEDNQCAIKTCGRKTSNLFCSPTDEEMLKKWQDIIGTSEKYFLVCENHFEFKDIVIEKCLEHTALPVINITALQSMDYKDKICGMCLEKLESKRIQLSKQKADDFKEITSYQPVKEYICESCESYFNNYRKFKTEIKEKHKRLRLNNTLEESDDDCVVVSEEKAASTPKPKASHPKLPPGIISTIRHADQGKNEKDLFRCKHCYYKTSESSALIEHIDTNHLFPCKQCPFISSNKPLLTLHINKFHSNDAIICGICNQTFIYKTDIDAHYEKIHKSQTCSYFMCFYCKTNCKNDIELKYHYNEFHPGGLTTAQHQINNTKLQLALLIGNKERKSHQAKQKSYNELMDKIKSSVTVKRISKKRKKSVEKFDFSLPINIPIKIPNCATQSSSKHRVRSIGKQSNPKMPITEVTIVTKNNYSENNVETPLSVSNSDSSENEADHCAISIDSDDSEYEVMINESSHGKKHDIKSILQHRKISSQIKKPFRAQLDSKATKDAFRCLTCNKYFEDVAQLLHHREIAHPPENSKRNYEDFDMSKIPADPYKIERNKKLNDDDGGVKVACDVCNLFIQEKNLDRHKQRHNNEKAFLCHICSSSFSDQTAFKYHMMRHEPESLYQCDMCGKGWVTKGRLNKHIKRSHLRIPNIKAQCPICRKKLYNKQTNILEVHMNKYHPNGMDQGFRVNEETNYYDCEKCGASYWDLYTFSRHSCEKGRLQIRCLDCHIPCSNAESLAKHKITKCRKINPFANSISLREIEMAKNKTNEFS